ncbi:hypothetical protein V5O48_006666 [Marasmius crinis-equi]|uniref:Protein kinase domain-containing protein n=1 Tax=Marasmius crinis-equi TaxID=585013 RepID=A0ABR3FIY7_9AGAR
MLRLSKNSGLHPKCLSIQNVRRLGDFPIAAGGFGDVWKGAIGESSQPVCLKIVKLYLGSDVEKLSKDYLREAIVWRQMRHANLLPFLGIYRLEQTQQLCLISPWMEKGNLIQYLKATRRDNVKHYTLVHDVASGLCHLHHTKIVHGDLKGVNILVTPDERACIGDFGLSRVADSHRLSLPTSTSRGPAGTARWLAPELLTGGDGTTRESDVYAFGCVCYEIFTGLHPFPEISQDAAVVLQVMLGARPRRPTNIVELNDSMWAIMKSCWVEDPHARPNADKVLAQVQQDNWVPSPTSPDWVEPLHRQIWSNVERGPSYAELDQQSVRGSADDICPAYEDIFSAHEDIFPAHDGPSTVGIYSGIQSPQQPAPPTKLAHILPAITVDDRPPPARSLSHNDNEIASRTKTAKLLLRYQRCPGWLFDAVEPLREFIDEIDPRKYYLDLDRESGSVFAARVTDTGKICDLNLPPLIKARDADDQRRGITTLVALKCVRIVHSDCGSTKIDDLRRELVLLRGLSHPNVLSMDAVYVDLVGYSLWIRMELMERSLADVLDWDLTLEEGMIASFTKDVVEALEFLRSHNIAHRNLHSANLLLDSEGVVKLTNFSDALKLPRGVPPIAYEPAGVLHCQAPEVQNGAYNALKADVWSLGAIVWEMAQARPPFPGSKYPPGNDSPDISGVLLSNDSEYPHIRWPPLDKPQSFSPAFHNFLRLCSEPAAFRPSPCDLLKVTLFDLRQNKQLHLLSWSRANSLGALVAGSP